MGTLTIFTQLLNSSISMHRPTWGGLAEAAMMRWWWAPSRQLACGMLAPTYTNINIQLPIHYMLGALRMSVSIFSLATASALLAAMTHLAQHLLARHCS
jgi:hypothetical protein